MKAFLAKVVGLVCVWFACEGTAMAQGVAENSHPAANIASPSLEVNTIAGLNIGQRVALLTKMTPAERMQLAEKFRALPPQGTDIAKINAFFMTWGQVDAPAALENAILFPTAKARAIALGALVNGMSSAMAAEVAPRLEKLPLHSVDSATRERLLEESIVKWSQLQPAAAAKFLDALYPNAAARLAKPGPGEQYLGAATRGVAENWGLSDSAKALDWFRKRNNWVGIENVIAGWWHKNPTAAAAYVSSHLGSDNKRKIAGALAVAMSQQKPRVAMTWVAWIQNETLRRRAQVQIATTWSAARPQEAADWAAKLSGKEQGAMLAVIAGVWGETDAGATTKWIDSLKGETRDAAISGYAVGIAAQDHEQAMTWALKVQNPVMHDRITKVVATDWLRAQPNEARAWIEKSQISPEEKQRLLAGS